MVPVRLKLVTLDGLSTIRHETSVSVDPSNRSPEFLVIRYEGVYQPGSVGHDDALYIVATATAARAAWYSTATVFDFRNLTYDWGDEMEWVTSITWNKVLRYHAPFAIVIGENCESAMRSLLRDDYGEHCVRTLEEVYEVCRKKAEDYAVYVRNWGTTSQDATNNDDT